MLACRNQPCEMGHVDHQVRADHIRDFAEAGEVDLARDGRTTGDYQLGFVFFCQRLYLIVIQQVVFAAYAVLHGVEPFTGLVRFGPVRQVTTGCQIHAKDGVARFDQRGEHTLVGLGAGVGLNVNEIAAKQFLGAINGEGLGHVYELATTIVTTARIAFGIFVRQHRPLGLHHGGGYDVFRGDQFDLVALTAEFIGDGTENCRITAREAFCEETGIFYVGHLDLLGWRVLGPSIGRVSDRKQKTDP